MPSKAVNAETIIDADSGDEIMELTKNEKNVFTNVINHIDNPNGRIIFKDIRKYQRN